MSTPSDTGRKLFLSFDSSYCSQCIQCKPTTDQKDSMLSYVFLVQIEAVHENWTRFFTRYLLSVGMNRAPWMLTKVGKLDLFHRFHFWQPYSMSWIWRAYARRKMKYSIAWLKKSIKNTLEFLPGCIVYPGKKIEFLTRQMFSELERRSHKKLS